MAKPRFHRLPPPRQHEVLDAAAREFALHGYEGASFNGIVAEVGASKGAIYYWFANKADLYGTVLQDSVDRMLAVMGDIEPSTTRRGFWKQLDEKFAEVGRFYREEPAAAVLALSVARGEGDSALVERGRKWVEELVAEGRSSGAMRGDLPTDLVAEVIWSMTEAADRWLVRNRHRLGREPEAIESVTRLVAETVRLAFQAPGGHRS